MTYRRMLGIDPADTTLEWGTRIQPQPGTLVKPPLTSGTVGTMEKTTTVRAVQDLLRDHGFCVRADGTYGNETRTALVRFAAQKGVTSSHTGSGREIRVMNPLWQALTARPTPGVSCPTGGGTAPPPVVDEELDIELDDRRPFLDTMREVPWWAWALIAAAMGFTGWRVHVARKRRRAARATLAPNRRRASRRSRSRRTRRSTGGPARRNSSERKSSGRWDVVYRISARGPLYSGGAGPFTKRQADRIARKLAAKGYVFVEVRRRTEKNPTHGRRRYALPPLRRV